MKINSTFIISLSICLLSCSSIYEQHYDNSVAYEKSTLRNKSWFPNLIYADAYNLKSASCLDSLSAFGEFSYSNSLLYDSIFNSENIKHIPLQVYQQKIERNKSNMPKWFHEPNLNSGIQYETINMDRFYLIKDNTGKKISFVLSY